MKRNLFWKFLLVVFVVLWSLWEMNPPSNRDLIEQFERSAERPDGAFSNIVERARAATKENPQRAFVNLAAAIGTNDITRYFSNRFNVSDELPADRTLAILHRVQNEAAGKIKLGLDLQGGTSFLVQMSTNELVEADARSAALSQAVEVLRKRVDRFGVSEPVIQPSGEDRILIQLPGLSEEEKESAKAQIQKAAFLEFRLVHERSQELVNQGLGAIGYTNLVQRSKRPDGQVVLQTFLVKKGSEKGLTGKSVKSAGVFFDPVTSEPKIHVTFDSDGAKLFADITKENVGRNLAIVLDGELYSAPRINEEILGGSCEISGSFDVQEAFNLANVLINPLEAPVRIVEERGVDPLLGKDSIASGIKAAVYGTVAVGVFMLVYYLFAGVVANVAMLLNIIVLLGVMCSVGTTMTLPGIAGIVLTIGMAVDANVLIYERIREELAAGKSIRGAVAAGYDKAFGTIFDSNITTLISSVILIFMGTGPVKGFGVTLTIGVLASMFTALVVTRLIFDWCLRNDWLKSLRMLSLVQGTRIDFLRWAVPAFVISWLLIVVGNGYGIFVRGKDVLGVEFAGGASVTLTFSQKVDVGRIRESVNKLSLGEALIGYQKDFSSGRETLQVTTRTAPGAGGAEVDAAQRVREVLQQDFKEAGFQVFSTEKVGAVVGKEIQRTAVVASLLALFGILVYVAFRYEFSFAVGAVVAILHDIFMTMGWFFLTGRELSGPMVAAILTIIGFSINDTIVIFDRVREDLKLGVRGTFRELMNHALNRTLSRTIITSGTVFLATLSLYLFGGSVINDFAFTFLVGILTGTYSSIYIACAIVLWWHKGERPKLASSQLTMEEAAPARA